MLLWKQPPLFSISSEPLTRLEYESSIQHTFVPHHKTPSPSSLPPCTSDESGPVTQASFPLLVHATYQHQNLDDLVLITGLPLPLGYARCKCCWVTATGGIIGTFPSHRPRKSPAQNGIHLQRSRQYLQQTHSGILHALAKDAMLFNGTVTCTPLLPVTSRSPRTSLPPTPYITM